MLISAILAIQWCVEAVLLTVHIGLTLFIAQQEIRGVAPFRNVFFFIYVGCQSVSDAGDFVGVSKYLV